MPRCPAELGAKHPTGSKEGVSEHQALTSCCLRKLHVPVGMTSSAPHSRSSPTKHMESKKETAGLLWGQNIWQMKVKVEVSGQGQSRPQGWKQTPNPAQSETCQNLPSENQSSWGLISTCITG